ncbi:binding protein [[Candida] boidinii]|nr:binding protein [[Candida] boidinii]
MDMKMDHSEKPEEQSSSNPISGNKTENKTEFTIENGQKNSNKNVGKEIFLPSTEKNSKTITETNKSIKNKSKDSKKLSKVKKEIDESQLARATLEQKIRVLDWHNTSEKKCQQKTVEFFKPLNEFAISKSTLNRWVLSEPQLRDEYKSLTLNNSTIYKTKPKFKNPEINRCLELFYEQISFEQSSISERDLTSKWGDFYKLYHSIDESGSTIHKKSNGWLHHFKKRNSVKRDLAKDFYSNQQSFQIESVSEDQARIKSLIKDIDPSKVFAIDEISFNVKPSFIVGNNPEQDKLGEWDPLTKVTVSLCCNSDGSQFKNPLIVTNDPRVTSSSFSNIFYSKTGVLTSEIFLKYMINLDQELYISQFKESKKRGDTQFTATPVYVLLDSLFSHIIPTDGFKCIKLVYFSPFLEPSFDIKPLSFGLTRVFKTLVKFGYLQSLRRKLLTSPNLDFELDKQDIISFIMSATTTLQSESSKPVIVNSFFRSSLVPSLMNDKNHAAFSRDSIKEDQLYSILKDIKSRGLLNERFDSQCLKQTGSRELDVDCLLFPPDEEISNQHLTEKDIVELTKREMVDVKYTEDAFEDHDSKLAGRPEMHAILQISSSSDSLSNGKSLLNITSPKEEKKASDKEAEDKQKGPDSSDSSSTKDSSLLTSNENSAVESAITNISDDIDSEMNATDSAAVAIAAVAAAVAASKSANSDDKLHEDDSKETKELKTPSLSSQETIKNLIEKYRIKAARESESGSVLSLIGIRKFDETDFLNSSATDSEKDKSIKERKTSSEKRSKNVSFTNPKKNSLKRESNEQVSKRSFKKKKSNSSSDEEKKKKKSQTSNGSKDTTNSGKDKKSKDVFESSVGPVLKYEKKTDIADIDTDLLNQS